MPVKPIPEGFHSLTPHLTVKGTFDRSNRSNLPFIRFWGEAVGRPSRRVVRTDDCCTFNDYHPLFHPVPRITQAGRTSTVLLSTTRCPSGR